MAYRWHLQAAAPADVLVIQCRVVVIVVPRCSQADFIATIGSLTNVLRSFEALCNMEQTNLLVCYSKALLSAPP